MFQRLLLHFKEFRNSQQFTGVLLLSLTGTSLLLSNTDLLPGYSGCWNASLGQNLPAWHLPDTPSSIINDGLMAVFFLLVGLEIRREVLSGELSTLDRASLPVAAALGGMVVPASIYFFINKGTDTAHGWGIPMATDIAFALGILSLTGKRIPDTLKILLTALAVADDLGAVAVIALFYSHGLALVYLLGALVVLMVLYWANRSGIRSLRFYLCSGLVLWYLIHCSGIHATVAGVLLAMVIPVRSKDGTSPMLKLEHALIKPVNYLILPLFAVANTAIHLQPDWSAELLSDSSRGIIAGLFLGKPIGILLAAWIAVKTGFSRMPECIGFKQLAGVGFLGGIGFTMSIFIALLALHAPGQTDNAKVAIMVASLCSGFIGYFILKLVYGKLPR